MNTININFPELGINQVEFLRNEILEHVIGPNHERGDGRLFQWQIIENDLKDFQRKQLDKMFDKRELVDGCYIHITGSEAVDRGLNMTNTELQESLS